MIENNHEYVNLEVWIQNVTKPHKFRTICTILFHMKFHMKNDKIIDLQYMVNHTHYFFYFVKDPWTKTKRKMVHYAVSNLTSLQCAQALAWFCQTMNANTLNPWLMESIAKKTRIEFHLQMERPQSLLRICNQSLNIQEHIADHW